MNEVFYDMLFRAVIFDDQRNFRPILARRTDYNSLQFGVKYFRPKMARVCRLRKNKISRRANGFRVIYPLFFKRCISSGLPTLVLTGHKWLVSHPGNRFFRREENLRIVKTLMFLTALLSGVFRQFSFRHAIPTSSGLLCAN